MLSLAAFIVDLVVEAHQRFGFSFLNRWKSNLGGSHFALFGPSGVGKTQISGSVAGDLSKLMSTPERTYQTREIKIDTHAGKLIVLDTPGHKEGEMSRNEGLQTVSSAKSYGIILVGAYGYHESRSMEAPPKRAGKAQLSWLDKKRQEELGVFQAVLHRAMILKRPNIVITLVNKADLWIDDWAKVKAFYESSGYHQQVTAAGVQHVILQYCVVPKKFWGLDKPSLKIDLSEARQLHVGLVDLLEQFAQEN